MCSELDTMNISAIYLISGLNTNRNPFQNIKFGMCVFFYSSALGSRWITGNRVMVEILDGCDASPAQTPQQ